MMRTSESRGTDILLNRYMLIISSAVLREMLLNLKRKKHCSDLRSHSCNTDGLVSRDQGEEAEPETCRRFFDSAYSSALSKAIEDFDGSFRCLLLRSGKRVSRAC